jgi:pilus assembly protein FimV
MRLRQLVLACGLTSLVLSPYASALGLGEVKLKSTLNQPLEAEVKLLDTRDLTAEQILVALASPADFERNGVDRLFFYTEFQFQVDLEAADGPKVVITSRSPVREPYLNFLIEARWTAGRLLREYTLLMDLPTFDEGGTTQTTAHYHINT